MTTDILSATIQKLASERMMRVCPDHNCPYIKTAIIDMMVPFITPLALVIEDKTRVYAADDNSSVDVFVTDVLYEVMATMGKFVGTSVQTTMDVCNACAQAASIDKGERH